MDKGTYLGAGRCEPPAAGRPHGPRRGREPSLVGRGSIRVVGGEAEVAVQTSLASSSLVEVLDRILDKGIVIDLWARVSLVGVELLAVEARVVVASVETWLTYAEAVGLTAQASA